MRLYAMKLGVPGDRIFCESEAKHTTENINNSIKIANALDCRRIAIATDIYQSTYIIPFLDELPAKVDLLPLVQSKIDMKGLLNVEIDEELALEPEFLTE